MFPYCYTPRKDFPSPPPCSLTSCTSCISKARKCMLNSFPPSLTHTFFSSSFKQARNKHTCIYLHCDSLQRLHSALWLKQTSNEKRKSRVQAAAINALSSYAGKRQHVGTHKTEKCSPDSSSTARYNCFLH